MPLRLRSFARTLTFAIFLPLGVAACATTPPGVLPVADITPSIEQLAAARYGAIDTEKFPVPAVSLKQLKQRNMRELVDYATDQPVGTVVVDPKGKYLYLVQEGGKALRYGVGVGKAGMEFTGTAKIAYKREWPRWTPTQDMIARSPEKYQQWAGGMEGGARNPLGARALYLFKDGKDTLYRIHGTNEPWSIGQAVSSGCIRMMNQDVIDLYDRIPDGSKVVVLG
ncbi:L,D-transpeptidase [Phyllobacterium myrsinacearum]|uniref:Lipoprotein-anchoring transpeptidase ErfK/SrfK n=1 Tax=Phyllobacterium myrsinacearum TaxID=28101 RepID=A0A839EFQ6_9HYPH|nr:L,D-transpeptidase [Phyllobacterium myrsinacearum]MBA8878993.1 lipoprotein-anchoring transpeptidase ErfK/SrfK [Phyllobacterium myrsinacearum]